MDIGLGGQKLVVYIAERIIKTAVLTSVFNEPRLIKGCLEQFYPFDLEHIVICSNSPWRGNWPKDNTDEIAENYEATVLRGEWNSDSEQRNFGLNFLRENNFDWTLIVDSDEFYTEEDINVLLNSIDNNYDVIIAPNMSVYWKTYEWLILPDPQPDNPIVAMKTDQKFSWSRLSDSQKRKSTRAHLHHLSYVRNDEAMKMKIDISEHKEEILSNWYNEVWLDWKPGDKYLHPVIPSQFFETIYRPLPKEIQILL